MEIRFGFYDFSTGRRAGGGRVRTHNAPLTFMASCWASLVGVASVRGGIGKKMMEKKECERKNEKSKRKGLHRQEKQKQNFLFLFFFWLLIAKFCTQLMQMRPCPCRQ